MSTIIYCLLERGEFMDQEDEKVILFPTWQKNLEQKSLEAMREKDYDGALEKINQLLEFNVENHELYIAKLICLMELRDHEGALELSEEMLHKKDESYFQYVHIYLTVLFQMGSYEQLIDHVEFEFREHDVPTVLAEQFKKLEEASRSLYEEMKIQQGVEYITEFNKAIDNRAFQKQWNILMRIRKSNIQIHSKLINILNEKDTHPMIQTAIFKCLQDQSYAENIHIRKLGMEGSFIPKDVPSIADDPKVQYVEQLLKNVEDEDPVMFQFMKQMIFRYAYVRYPFSFEEDQLSLIAEIIKQLAMNSFSEEIHTYEDPMYALMAEEIEMSISLYLSVAEE